MGTILAVGRANGVNLSAAQAGNGVSTNIVQRRTDLADTAALLLLVATAGATPTCTYLIEGSPAGVNWFPIPTQDLPVAGGPPGALTSAPFTLTATTTLWKLIPVDFPWGFLRITYSANTNVTNQADVWVY